MDIAVVALTFAAIFLVELPDKTFIATLVMATRMRPLFVWIGVGAAFFIQTLIAVALGKAAGFLPDTIVHSVAALMFIIGAVVLFREARSADEGTAETEREFAEKAGSTQGIKVIGTSFLVLFAAEWGDLSQLLTASLAAKYDDPISVFIGAWGALLAVSGLAVILGRVLLNHVKLSVLYYVGAAVCFMIACYTVFELLS